jgi:Collagen triple helix repeat (20 copies)
MQQNSRRTRGGKNRALATGPQGPAGPQGVQAVPGAQGQAGSQGPQAPQGAPGEKGAKGDAAKLNARAVQGDNTVRCDAHETLVSVFCPSGGAPDGTKCATSPAVGMCLGKPAVTN